MLLLVAPLLLSVLPLRRVLTRLRPARRAVLSPERVAQLVDIAARRVPGARCLSVAVVTSWLLARQGTAATLRIGVAKPAGELAAHAWVECGGMRLGGADDTHRYRPILTMAPPGAHEARR